MHKTTALFLDRASLFPDDLDFSELEVVASWQWFDNANLNDILHCLADAEIIVSNKKIIDSEVMDCCPRLRLICVAATGVNNVDAEAARQRDIKVCNVRAYATSSVAQHVFSLILSLNRKLFSYREAAINGQWSRSDFFCYFGQPVSDLAGKTIGIIGYGELGHAVAAIARCFGMEVLIAKRDDRDSREGRVELETLLSVADIVSLHCPLTENNYHMISASQFSLMKPEAILVNTARGGLVDETALLQALQNEQIAAAALDVLEQEPPAVNHPLLNHGQDNLIITPHIAWASRESRQRLVDEIAKNIQAFQQGKQRNLV
jgi:glycerate dehydrogenase